MNDGPDSNAPVSLVSVGRDAGFLAHELRNVLTVYFGLVEELQAHQDQDIQQAAELLSAATDKTQDIAQQIFALRERAVGENSVDPAAVLEELLPDCGGLASLREAFSHLPKLWGSATAIRSLLLHLDKASSPLGAVVSEPMPGVHPGAGFRLKIAVSGPVSDRDERFLAEAAQMLGGDCQRGEGAELLVDFRA